MSLTYFLHLKEPFGYFTVWMRCTSVPDTHSIERPDMPQTHGSPFKRCLNCYTVRLYCHLT
jgi:hypothetical protein